MRIAPPLAACLALGMFAASSEEAHGAYVNIHIEANPGPELSGHVRVDDDGVADGVLDLQFSDLGGDPSWVRLEVVYVELTADGGVMIVGRSSAGRVGEVISVQVIPRPHEETADWSIAGAGVNVRFTAATRFEVWSVWDRGFSDDGL